MSQAVLDGVRDLLPDVPRARRRGRATARRSPRRRSRSWRRPGSSGCCSRTRFDGLEADPVDFYTAVRDIAGACGSTGWVSSVRRRAPVAGRAVRRRGAAGGVGRGHQHPAELVVRPDRQGRAHRRRLHAVAASGASPPAATTAPGCCSAAWSSTTRARSSTSRPSWSRARSTRSSTSGTSSACAGTGSNDIVVEDVFVPEAFTLSMGDTGRCFGPGQEQNTSDLYKLPFHSIFTSTITTPIIGMAYGRVRRARRDAAEARARGVPRREGVARPVRRGADRPRVVARSTPPGRC